MCPLTPLENRLRLLGGEGGYNQDFLSHWLQTVLYPESLGRRLQIALGAGFRHRAFGLLPHVIGAMIVPLVILLAGVFVLQQFPRHRALRPAAIALVTITGVQVVLGIAAYFARMNAAAYPLAMVLTTVAHVATGGLTLAASVVLAIQIRRNVRVTTPEIAQARQAVTS